jgi:hypothetical protein
MRKVLGMLAIASGVSMHAHGSMAADDRVRQWVSPDRQVTVSSVVGHQQDGITQYELSLARAGQKPVLIDEYIRSVDVSFTSDSKYVAVTDWIGSNVADCYVIDTNTPKNPVSITGKLPKLQENLNGSHAYIACGNWLSATTIDVRVSGHTDDPPFHDFDYRFVYDVESGWLKAP